MSFACWICGRNALRGDAIPFRTPESLPLMCVGCDCAALLRDKQPERVKQWEVPGLDLWYDVSALLPGEGVRAYGVVYLSAALIPNVEVLLELANLNMDRLGARREVVHQTKTAKPPSRFRTYVRWLLPRTEKV